MKYKPSDYAIAQSIIAVVLLLLPLLALVDIEAKRILIYAHDWVLYIASLLLIWHFAARRFIKKLLANQHLFRPLIVFSATILATALLYAPSYLLSLIWHEDIETRKLLVGFLTAMNFMLSLIWCIGYVSALAARERTRLEETYKKQSLKLLSQQIQPGFLYQSLDNIDALIAEDEEKASNAITNLAELLRYKLKAGQHDEVDLYDELNAVTYMQNLANAGELEIHGLEQIRNTHIMLPPLLVYNLLYQLNYKVDQPLAVKLESLENNQYQLLISGLTHNPRVIKKRIRAQYPDFFAANTGFHYKDKVLSLTFTG